MQATIVIPIFNGSTTLQLLFKGLEKQKQKRLVNKILLIDDCSSDDSKKIARNYKNQSTYDVQIILNKTNQGLAANYNQGLKNTDTELCILMQQDIFLTDTYSLIKIIEPLRDDKTVVGTYPTFKYTRSHWERSSFWQKVLFSRLIDKEIAKFNGKFDCIRKVPGLYFDSQRYRTAGEDYDYEMRLSSHGEIRAVGLQVEHLQEISTDFSLEKLIKKEAQLAECYGANFRRYYARMNMTSILLLLGRIPFMILAIVALIKFPIAGVILLLFYAISYTARIYAHCWKDPRVIMLPVVNLVNLVGYFYFFSKGVITGKQEI